MATFTKFNTFVGDLGDKVHDLDLDTLKVMLTNTLPVNTNTVKANITEISAGNGYTAGGEDITNVWSETGGVGTLSGTDVVWTASGGSIGPFRYVVIYNDTPTSPADPLVGWYDYGSSITVLTGETFTVDFTTSVLTLQ
jgi:hypothetical protein